MIPIPFQFDSFQVRVVPINGEPWFVARDVATALGYADTVNAIKQHARGVAKHHPIVDNLGRAQEARIISEPDLFRMIVSSNLLSAQRFERWVFERVLPEIRRTGAYSNSPFAIPQTMSEALRLAADLSEHNDKLTAQIKQQAPKVAALERIAESDGTQCLAGAAKALQVKPYAFNRWLRDRCWIFQRDHRWVAFQSRIDSGYLVHKLVVIGQREGEPDRTTEQVRVTAKGMAKLAELLAEPPKPASTTAIEALREVLH